MSLGAENIDINSNELLSAIATGYSRSGTIKFAFASAGEKVAKYTSFEGSGSDFTLSPTIESKNTFRDVLSNYSAVADVLFLEVSDTSDADIVLQMVQDVPGGVGGYFVNYIPDGDTSYKGAIVVNRASEGLLTHELGHGMGIHHPFNDNQGTTTLPGVVNTYDSGDFGFNSAYYTTMAYRTGEIYERPDANPYPQTSLGTFDVAALQALYGTNRIHAAENNNYNINSKIETIWDTGGIDHIDFSLTNTNAAVDLRAATLTVSEGGAGRASLADVSGGWTGGYLISYGVIIENGSTGSGDDELFGNDIRNILKSGSGDDLLQGYGGNDLLISGVDNLPDPIVLAILNNNTDQDSSAQVNDLSVMGDAFTLDFTFKINPNATQFQRIVTYNIEPTDEWSSLGFYLVRDDRGYLFLYLPDSDSSSYIGSYVGSIEDSELHRLTFARNSQSGDFLIYLDGTLIDTHQNQSGGASSAFVGGGSLLFGDTFETWNGNALEGGIGEVRLYDDYLSESEISELNSAPLEFANDPRLAHYWAVNPANTNLVIDAVGNKNLTLSQVMETESITVVTDNDRIYGNAGNDVIYSGTGNDLIGGGAGYDTIIAGDGNDRVWGGLGRDTIFLQDGDDVFNDDTQIGTHAIDTVRGGAGNDVLNGAGGDDRLYGDSGNDTIIGGIGNDLIGGGSGYDTIDAGTGNDRVWGGAGRDTVNLGAGDDVFNDDTQIGIHAIDTVRGGAGSDTINGGGGDDRFYGDSDDDVVRGGDGNDLLVGGTGNDFLDGGTGSDSFWSQLGMDTLTGGFGIDIFNFSTADSSEIGQRDTITDFMSGVDRINLALMDANSSVGGNQAFIYIGGSTFSAAGQLRFVSNAVDGFLLGDVTGNGTADFTLLLTGVVNLDSADIIL